MQITAKSPFETWFCSPEEPASGRDRRADVFCFPCAGAGAASFFGLCRALPRFVVPYVLRLPGRESARHMPAMTDIASMASAAANALRPRLGERPAVFWGHSMGALVAFEVAQLLRSEGAPALLVASGHAAPRLRRRREPVPIQQLSDDAFIDLLERYNGTPRAVLADRDLLSVFMPQLRSDFTALDAYAYVERGPLECDVFCLNGQGDQLVSKEGAQAWREQTRGKFRCEWLPGEHFFLNQDLRATVRVVGEAIATSLEIAV
ncbi:MAG: alpha/beta fold hydrolase [Dokdonella sp.]